MLKIYKFLEKTTKCYHTRKNYSTYKAKPKLSVPKMNAWQIHSYGDLSELQMTKSRIPIISNPDDILIKVEAASLNPIDYMMIQGYGRNILNKFRSYDDIELPLTLGRDFAGKIVGKGHGVQNEFEIGDSVYGIVPVHKQGSHAEFVIADKSLTRIRPSNWTPMEATSILYAAMTAWSALWITGEYCLKSPKNKIVLILGASGGVGTVATQILKAYDTTVIGTCSADATNLVLSLGANQVFDYKQPNYIEEIAAIGKIDIILDCAKFGIENIPQKWNYSKYITLNSPLMVNTDKYGLVGGLASSIGELAIKNINIMQGKSVRWGFFAPFSNGLTLIDKLAQNGKITPIIQETFKFSDMPSAYKSLQAGHLRGKIVLKLE